MSVLSEAPGFPKIGLTWGIKRSFIRYISGFGISYHGPFREFHDHSGPAASPAALVTFAPAAAFVGVDKHPSAEALVEQVARMFGPEAAHPNAVHVADWSREPATVPRVFHRNWPRPVWLHHLSSPGCRTHSLGLHRNRIRLRRTHRRRHSCRTARRPVRHRIPVSSALAKLRGERGCLTSLT